MTDDVQDTDVESDVAVADKKEGSSDLDLKVEIENVGPCKKHISVTISEADIQQLREETISELGRDVAVPGFRPGKVPAKLLARRFRKEIADQLKQKLLLQSLEQVSEDHDIEPINEPDIDVENLEVPETGDFEYEMDVEVRPVFEVPDYENMTIRRPVCEIDEETVKKARDRYLAGLGQISPYDGPAESGDYVVCDCQFLYDGKEIRHYDELTMQLQPTLRFWDAEIDGFDELMSGAKAGDTREFEIRISREADQVEMRDEPVQVKLKVLDVKRVEIPEIDDDVLSRIGVDSAEKLDEVIKESLERQVSYRQRQQTREQVLEKITESADWDLPEGLVKKHVDNALRREILEMQQSGFSREQIRARESELRQRSHSTTEQALKEHFVLDKIASDNEIECTSEDVTYEITVMAMQQGENPRKLRSRLIKNGMIENLEAQIRERKAVDFILSKVSFEDEPMEDLLGEDVETIEKPILSSIADTPESENEEGDED